MPPFEDRLDLTGQLLLAMPSMMDPRFSGAVIYMCAHSDEGAMGLIINKPAEDVTIEDIFAQMELSEVPEDVDMPVHFGGPVEHGRGFVLHSPDYTSDLHTLTIDPQFSMTGTMDILEHIAAGQGPARALMMLGYAGWGPAQLEAEILSNGWLTCAACPELVFDTEDNQKWSAALQKIGVDPVGLSTTSGRA